MRPSLRPCQPTKRKIFVPKSLIAKASTSIAAPAAKVWDALVNPQMIKQYIFGATVVSDWREGGPNTWKSRGKGKTYEDKRRNRQNEPRPLLQYSHYTPLSGPPGIP